MCTSGHSFNWQANDFSLVAKTFPFMISRASGKNPLLFFFRSIFPTLPDACKQTCMAHAHHYMKKCQQKFKFQKFFKKLINYKLKSKVSIIDTQCLKIPKKAQLH